MLNVWTQALLLAEQRFLLTEPPPQLPNLLILVVLFINYIISNAKYVSHTVIILLKTLDAGAPSIGKISSISFPMASVHENTDDHL